MSVVRELAGYLVWATGLVVFALGLVLIWWIIWNAVQVFL